jgi:hypothetical protein
VDALVAEGPCAWHRRTFSPIRQLLAGTQLPLDLVFEPIDDGELDLDLEPIDEDELDLH